MRKTIDPRFLFQEADPDGKAALPQSLEKDVLIGGERVLMELYLPSGYFPGPHPTVILCHGIPGTTNNDDLAQDLRRMGCAVLRPYHRGAWGSGGTYSFTHCIEDTLFLARWVQDPVRQDVFHLDPDNLFLAGHSNGGNTVIQTSKQLPFLRGSIAFCPFDHLAYAQAFGQAELEAMFKECSPVLHLESLEALCQDSREHAAAWDFAKAASWFQDRNLLLIGGEKDPVAPPKLMVDQLWQALSQHPTKAHHKKVIFPSNHSLDNARLALSQTIGTWIAEIVNGIEPENKD